MEPREYLRLVRRRWWLIALVAVVGGAFAWLTAPANVAPRVQRFAAEHILIVEPESRQWTPENPETIALLASSGDLPRRVAARLSLAPEDAERVLRNVTVTGEPLLGIIKFRAVTGSAARSEELANIFAEELVTFLDEQETDARARLIESAKQQTEDLQVQIGTVSDQIARGEGDPQLLEEQRLVLVSQFGDAEARYRSLLAEPPASSGLRTLGPAFASEVDAGIHPPRGRAERALILGFVGMLLGLVVVVTLERLDVRIKTKEEAEAAFRLPVIAEIPSLPVARRRQRIVMSHAEPASSIAEAYRGLRTTLLILKPMPITPSIAGRDPMRRRATDHLDDRQTPEPVPGMPAVFLITSTRPSEGKTTTTVNLAAAYAEAGRSVLVIGADIRRPEAHEYLQVPRTPGLTEALLGRAPVRLRDLAVATSIPGVRMIPPGAHVSNPGELLLQGPELIAEARSLADIVLVDTTPLLTVNDAIQLIPAVDAVILACRAGRDTTEAAKRAQEILARLRVPVTGVVLVGAREAPGVSSYYYGYQSGSSTSPLARLRRGMRRRTAEREQEGGPAPQQDDQWSPITPPIRTAPPERRAASGTAEVEDVPAEVDDRAPRSGARTNGQATAGAHAGTQVPNEPDPWGWP